MTTESSPETIHQPTPPPPPPPPPPAHAVKEESSEELPPPPETATVAAVPANAAPVVDIAADLPDLSGTNDDLLTELYDDVMQCVYDDVASTGGDLDIFAAAASGENALDDEETPPAPPERTLRTVITNGTGGGVVTETPVVIVDRPLPQKPSKNSAFSMFRMGVGGGGGKVSWPAIHSLASCHITNVLSQTTET